MAPSEQANRRAEKIAALDAQLRSGESLTATALAHHLNVDRKYVPQVAEACGLELEGTTYPWRRIWRHIHGTEGIRLVAHLAALKERHPDSQVLADIDDLEVALRAPLIDFATMAARLGRKPDTISKRLRRGQETLPFPILELSDRSRHFRPFEVRLWAEEEIRLDLPEPLEWLKQTAPVPEAAQQAPTSPKQTVKATFGCFAEHNPTPAT